MNQATKDILEALFQVGKFSNKAQKKLEEEILRKGMEHFLLHPLSFGSNRNETEKIKAFFRFFHISRASKPIETLWDVYKSLASICYLNMKSPLTAESAIFIYFKQNQSNIRICKIEENTVGDISKTLVNSQLALKTALETKSQSVAFVHNHPSGSPLPSADDERVSKRLAHLFRMGKINLLATGVLSPHIGLINYFLDNNEYLDHSFNSSEMVNLLLSSYKGQSLLSSDSYQQFRDTKGYSSLDNVITFLGSGSSLTRANQVIDYISKNINLDMGNDVIGKLILCGPSLVPINCVDIPYKYKSKQFIYEIVKSNATSFFVVQDKWRTDNREDIGFIISELNEVLGLKHLDTFLCDMSKKRILSEQAGQSFPMLDKKVDHELFR